VPARTGRTARPEQRALPDRKESLERRAQQALQVEPARKAFKASPVRPVLRAPLAHKAFKAWQV
jgi:hypothetical protein